MGPVPNSQGQEEQHQAIALNNKIQREFRRQVRAEVVERLNAMVSNGEPVPVTQEELNLLIAFRDFKAGMKRDGLTFKWQTRRISADEFGAWNEYRAAREAVCTEVDRWLTCCENAMTPVEESSLVTNALCEAALKYRSAAIAAQK